MAQESHGNTPAAFIAKWSRVELSERAASQEHFIDVCRLLGQPTPAEHDATGAEYTFEKGVAVTDSASRGSAGERGFADVWWRGKFAWEYKRKGKYRDLTEAYRQLIRQSAIMARPAKDKNLKRRTLTNLYNERPTWLRLAHERLDRAVLAACAAVDPEGDWSPDWAEVWLETGAGQPLPAETRRHARPDGRVSDQRLHARGFASRSRRAGTSRIGHGIAAGACVREADRVAFSGSGIPQLRDRTFMQRLTAAVTCLAFIAVTIGLPLPVSVRVPKSDEDFPCKHHGCGCIDAEMCRTRCCCVKKQPTGASQGSCCGSATSPGAGCRIPQQPAEKTAPVQGRGISKRQTDSSRSAAKLTPLECKGVAAHWVVITILPCSERVLTFDAAPAPRWRVHAISELLSPQAALRPPSPPPKA